MKTRTVATVGAIVMAVALPQLFHVAGRLLGVGTALGETFLPMHIAIFAVGLLAGTYVGGIAGLLAPLVSCLLTGMPAYAMLPFMMIELASYGLISGALSDKNIPTIVKLLIAQIGGRAIRAVALLIGFYGFSTQIPPITALTSIKTGLPGLLIQWVTIPLVMYFVARSVDRDE
ncbi:MAG: ECF transporter S component [Eubacterium sp.]|nr:ECF transporter S component [Eubacterium sp.]